MSMPVSVSDCASLSLSLRQPQPLALPLFASLCPCLRSQLLIILKSNKYIYVLRFLSWLGVCVCVFAAAFVCLCLWFCVFACGHSRFKFRNAECLPVSLPLCLCLYVSTPLCLCLFVSICSHGRLQIRNAECLFASVSVSLVKIIEVWLIVCVFADGLP